MIPQLEDCTHKYKKLTKSEIGKNLFEERSDVYCSRFFYSRVPEISEK